MNNPMSQIKSITKKQKCQISIKLDSSVIKLSLSTFMNILECEITNNATKSEINKKNIIDLNYLVNDQYWKPKYQVLKNQAIVFQCVMDRLKRDLKTNKFAQPKRCLASSVNQNVCVTMGRNALENSNKKYQKFTTLDSEDDAVIITNMSKIKPIQTKNNNIIDLIDLDSNTHDMKVKYKPTPESKPNCKSDSEDDAVIITDMSKIKPIQTKNNNIIDLIDLDSNTHDMKVKYKPTSESKPNCKSDSEDDAVIITGMSKIKPIQTRNNNNTDLIDLHSNTHNLKVKYKATPESKPNCKSDSEDDAVIITGMSKIKPIQTRNNNNTDLIDLHSNTHNLKVKHKPTPGSKTNVFISDFKINDNDKILPINTEASKTLSNREYLSTTKRKPGPKSKTMFVGDMVPFNAENEETVKKKMRLNECEVINYKELNINKLLNCNSVKKSEVPERYNHYFRYKSSNLKYPPPFPLIPPHNNQPSWKNVPPRPNMIVKTSGNKVTLIWDLNLTWQIATIKMYELFICQETDAPPNITMWKKKGIIESDLLPMACELEVYELGYIYHFALRAVDVHNRRAPFAVQKTEM